MNFSKLILHRSVPSQPTETPAALPTPAALVSVKPVFAPFEEPAVEAVPAVRHEPIAPDLSNVRVPLALSEAQRERLARDGFVVSPGVEKEFFTVYEKARYANVPIFVTSDSLLHVYHLLFDKVLRTAEVQHFIPLLRDLNQALLSQTDSQYQVLQGPGWEDAARRTVAFVGVASKLLDPDVQVPDYAKDLVETELALPRPGVWRRLHPVHPPGPLYQKRRIESLLQEHDVVRADDFPPQDRRSRSGPG
jgi:hypothetical protein